MQYLNISEFLRVYESQNQSAHDVKNEATRQFEEAKKLDVDLPHNIIIGPFLVNVNPLRNRLIKKRIDMAKAILDLLARQLRKQSDTVGSPHRTKMEA